MSQQQPPTQPRGRGGAGRGGGAPPPPPGPRPVPGSTTMPYPSYGAAAGAAVPQPPTTVAPVPPTIPVNQHRGGGGGQQGAWQPAMPPSSLQQAQQAQQQQEQHQQQQGAPQQQQPPPPQLQPPQQQQHPHPHQHPQQQQQQQHPQQQPYGQQQQQPRHLPPHQQPPHQPYPGGGAGGGGMYYHPQYPPPPYGWQPGMPPHQLQQQQQQQQQQLPPGQQVSMYPPHFPGQPYGGGGMPLPHQLRGGAGGGGPGGVFYPQNAGGGGGTGAMRPQAPGVGSNLNAASSASSLQAALQRGGPPPTSSGPAPPLVQPPRPKKPLVITDKEGNVIDLGDAAAKSRKPPTATATAATTTTTATTTTAAASTATVTPPSTPTNSNSINSAVAAPAPAPVASLETAGEKLRRAALERIEGKKPAPPTPAAVVEASTTTAPTPAPKDTPEPPQPPQPPVTEAKSDNNVTAAKPSSLAAAAADAGVSAKETTTSKVPAAVATPTVPPTKPKVEPPQPKEEAAAATVNEKAPPAAPATSAPVPPPSPSKSADKAAAPPPPAPRRSLAEIVVQKPKTTPSATPRRIVYGKDALLRLKTDELVRQRPESLPDMTVVKGPSRGKSGGERGGGGGGGGGGQRGSNRGEGGGGGGGGEWSRGSAPPRRQSSTGDQPPRDGGGGGGASWARGHAPPKNQQNKGRQRSGRGAPLLYDGPVAPLVKSENHWKPKKNSSPLVVAEKQVKAILNKMTKEKFDRLAGQMIEIPIISSDMLSMMIDNVFDKAIDEPSFGDMYADLCVRLSRSALVSRIVHVIESDEEPPTEDGSAPKSGESSTHVVYRWSNDISTSDSEVVGPFGSEDECYDAALVVDDEIPPVERGDMELELVSVSIRRGVFVKIMKKKVPEPNDDKVFYAVYFPVSEAEECGQQLSEIFLSEVECRNDAKQKNSFKRSLLNKCQEEFDKHDRYEAWLVEKKDYEAKKSSMTESERAEKEEELEFRRIRIKKQMLGNVKFIGQLYKVGLIRPKIMRFCIASLLKLESEENAKVPDYKDSGRTDMDEEDHEALCSIFTTIGPVIDDESAAQFMDTCFTKIKKLSVDKALPSRSRFMYKDLIELRGNNWVPRRKEEKAKTLDEIRRDVEQEERRQAQVRAGGGGGGGPGGGGGGGRGGGDYRGGSTSGRGGGVGGGPRSSLQMASRTRQQSKPETDDDGFTTIASSRTGFASKTSTPTKILQPSKSATAPPPKPGFGALNDDGAAVPDVATTPKPLSEGELEKRFKSIRTYFMDDGDVDELVRAVDKFIPSTPGAGKQLVTKYVDGMMECKDQERAAMVKILSVLFEKGKLTRQDVEGGLADPIEFIDSTKMDCPRAFEYLSVVLGELLRIKAIALSWLCRQLEKPKSNDANSKAPEEILRLTLRTLKASSGGSKAVDEARLSGGNGAAEKLLGADKWLAIAQAI